MRFARVPMPSEAPTQALVVAGSCPVESLSTGTGSRDEAWALTVATAGVESERRLFSLCREFYILHSRPSVDKDERLAARKGSTYLASDSHWRGPRTHGRAGVVFRFQLSQQDRQDPPLDEPLPFYFFSPAQRRQKKTIPWMDVPCRLGVATSHHMQLPARRWSRATHLRACSLGKLQPPTKLSLT